MSEQRPKEQENKDQDDRKMVRGVNIWAILLLTAVAVIAWSLMQNAGVSTVSMTYFNQLVEGKNFNGTPLVDGDGKPLEGTDIEKISLRETEATGVFKIAPPPEPRIDAEGKTTLPKEEERLNKQFRLNIPPADSPDRSRFTQLLEKNEVNYEIAPPSGWNTLMTALFVGFMLGLLLLMFVTMRRAQGQMMGGGFLSNFSKSPAKRYEAEEEPITFKDVAGLESVKADLQEIVEFLKNPTKFQKLGGRVPKAVP